MSCRRGGCLPMYERKVMFRKRQSFCHRYGGIGKSTNSRHASAQQEISAFCADSTLQALLLSAHRNASGLTLTAASNVLILEPHPERAVEDQMIGRVHRIGQRRQTHVFRLVVKGSDEERLGLERNVMT